MKRCIITPTFVDHFHYIKKYLQSFDTYLIDRDFPIYFIINKEESNLFRVIIEKYKNKLNLNIVFLEDIFERFNIKESPALTLKKYGRLSFQTLKKLYSALHIEYEEFLFLDSESMLVKPTNINNLFNDFFASPRIFVSRIADKPDYYKDDFTYEFTNAVTSLFNENPKYYTTEVYEWFYKLDILKDLVKNLGNIIDIVKNYKMPKKFNNLEGILEALLYYNYILYNNDKYQYKIYIIEDELKNFLSKENYYNLFNKVYNSKMFACGIIEIISFYLNKDNYKEIAKFFYHHKITIARIEDNRGKINPHYSSYIMNNSFINICPSSQDHHLGTNNNFFSFFINFFRTIKRKYISKYTKLLYFLSINIFFIIYYKIKILIKQFKLKTISIQKNFIDEQDITFICSGLLFDKNSKYNAEKCLRSIRKFFPKSKIILSIYDYEKIWFSTNLYDDLLTNTLSKIEYSTVDKRADYFPKYNTYNDQIRLISNAITKCNTKYAIRIRTDFYLENNNLLSTYCDLLSLNSQITSSYKIFDKLVLTISHGAINPYSSRDPLVHHTTDLFFFGLTVDLAKLYDFHPMPEKIANYFALTSRAKKLLPYKNIYYFYHLYAPEQYIWIRLLDKYKIKYTKPRYYYHLNAKMQEETMQIFYSNFLFADECMLGIVSKFDKNLLFARDRYINPVDYINKLTIPLNLNIEHFILLKKKLKIFYSIRNYKDKIKVKLYKILDKYY